MISGQMYSINNGTSASHGFGIGMNMEVHQWWYQSPHHSTPLAESTKAEKTFDNALCFIPYGIDIRRDYFTKFWDTKRKFHRNQRIQKRRRDRKAKKAEKKKIRRFRRLLMPRLSMMKLLIFRLYLAKHGQM